MKFASFLPALALPLALAACGGGPETTAADQGSEAEVARKAAEIRAQADNDVNQQIAEIDASANSERAELPAQPATAEQAFPPGNR